MGQSAFRFAGVAAIVVLTGCSGSDGSIAGTALLQGASDNAGIAIALSGPRSATAVTGSDGSFAFPRLPSGDYVVIATARSTREATLIASAHVSHGLTRLADLAFTPLGAVAGQATLGAPTGNAGISVVAVGASSIAVTDENGYFVLEGLGLGPHELIASKDGYLSATASGVVVDYAQTTTLPSLSLTPRSSAASSGRIDGKVVLDGLADARGVTVTLIGPTPSAAVTASDGAYAFSGLADGTYTVTAAAPSTAEQTRTSTFDLVGGENLTVPPLTFTPLGILVGRATLAGSTTGNSGILVFAAGTSTAAFTTDAGDYVLPGLRAGVYTVQAVKNGFDLAEALNQTVAYDEQRDVSDLNLTPSPSTASTTVSGVATLLGLASSGGTTVTVGSTGSTTTTLGDGSYSVSGVPQGVYPVTFANGAYQEQIPTVLAMAPGNGYVVDGALYPLQPIEIPRARRLMSSSSAWPLQVTAGGSKVLFETDYAGNGATLWVGAVAGGTPVKVGTNAYNYSAKLTPDGSTLYFLADLVSGATSYGVLHEATTATGFDMTVASGVERFDASPDGNFVVYQLIDGTVQLRTSAGTTTTLPNVTAWCGFSPDSQTVLVTGSGGLQAVSTADGTRTTIASSGCGTWSPDGQYILFVDGMGLQRVASAGGPVSLINAGPKNGGISFSPDGSRFVFFDSNVSPTALKTALVSTGGATSIASGSFPHYRFAPDSQHFVFMLADGTLQSWSSSAGTVTLGAATPNDDDFRISPDSSRVLFQYNKELFVVPIVGGTPTSLGAVVDSGDVGPPEFDFTGDSAAAVFLRGLDVLVEPLTGGATTLIGSNVQRRQHGLSPDGAKVWLLTDSTATGTLQVGYVSGAPPITLLRHVSTNTLGIFWAANDSLLAVRIQSATPYRFQDGLYAADTP